MKKILLLAFLLGAGPALAAEGPDLSDLLKQPTYHAAWNAMLAREKGIAPWLARFDKTFDGVTVPAETVTIGGKKYLLVSVCQAHNCGATGNTLYVLFAEGGRQVWGLYVSGKSGRRWFGNPDASLRAVLTKAADKAD